MEKAKRYEEHSDPLQDRFPGPAPLKYGGQATVKVRTGVLSEERSGRLVNEPELLVKDARSTTQRRFGDLLSGEWQVPQLAGIGLGAYMLVSALA